MELSLKNQISKLATLANSTIVMKHPDLMNKKLQFVNTLLSRLYENIRSISDIESGLYPDK